MRAACVCPVALLLTLLLLTLLPGVVRSGSHRPGGAFLSVRPIASVVDKVCPHERAYACSQLRVSLWSPSRSSQAEACRPFTSSCPLDLVTQQEHSACLTLLPQLERLNFYECAERLLAGPTGELLLGYIERLGNKTVMNPTDKSGRVISCSHVEALVTLDRFDDIDSDILDDSSGKEL